MAFLIVGIDKKCLDVSIINPLHLNAGSSDILIGNPMTSYYSLLLSSKSCE